MGGDFISASAGTQTHRIAIQKNAMAETRTYPISVHPTIIDKSDEAGLLGSAKNWAAGEYSAQAIAESILQGLAYAPVYQGGRRKTANFLCSGFLAADKDGGMSLDDAKNHAFVRHHATFIHTTASHTAACNRYRIMFLLKEPIKNAQDWANAQLGIALKMDSDKSVADGARMFFGNRAAEIYQIGNSMPPDAVADLIARGRDAREAGRLGRGSMLPVVSARRIAGPALVKLAGGEYVRLDSLVPGVRLHCPHHDDGDPSAFALLSRTGGLGIRCSACRVTFWSSDGQDGYDFDAFDRLFQQLQSGQHEIGPEATGFDRFFPPAPRFVKHQDRFLPSIGYEPGITLVKSPKGTGKTEALKSLIHSIRHQLFKSGIPKKEWAKSVLLIGHRQSLLREAAKKLGLHCYLDGDAATVDAIRTLAVTLDSLPKYNETDGGGSGGNRKAFDLVIIDESEQVFGHLFGETIKKGRGLERCFDAMKFEIANAKAVVALDADLGLVTTHALRTMRPQDWHSRCRIIYNSPVPPEQTRSMRLHSSKPFLLHEMIGTIKRGERCFVVSNSKKFINTAERMIRRECGGDTVMRVITSDNSRDEATLNFLANITTEFLNVQVVLGTPSIGTGIDITFPNGECCVDRVFGFFYPFINTHTDIDQQLARVRNPGKIDVWINPANYNFTCNVEVIMDDLARAYVVKRAVKGRPGADGMVDYDRNEPLLMICTHVTSLRRASMNKLTELFCALREANGWAIEWTSEKADDGPYKAAQKALAAERRDMLLGAPTLGDADFKELNERVKVGAVMTKEERIAHERNGFERDVGIPLDEALIGLNADGKLLEKVEVLSEMVSLWSNEYSVDLVDKLLEPTLQPYGRIEFTKPEHMLAMLMRVAGLTRIDGVLAEARVTVNGLTRFVDICRENKTTIEEMFGQPIRGDFMDKPVRQLNQFLRRIGLRLPLVEVRKIAGNKLRYYGFDREQLATMLRLAESHRQATAERKKKENEDKTRPLRQAQKLPEDVTATRDSLGLLSKEFLESE